MNKTSNKATIRYERTGDTDNDRFIDQLETAVLVMVRRFKLRPNKDGDIRFELIVDAATLHMHAKGTVDMVDLINSVKARDRTFAKDLEDAFCQAFEAMRQINDPN
jgi:hypothetical protein